MSALPLLADLTVLLAAILLATAGRTAGGRAGVGAGALGAAALALSLELWLGARTGPLVGGALVQDRFSLLAKAAVLLGLVLTLVVARRQVGREPGGAALAFVATLGAMTAASASNVAVLWLSVAAAVGAGTVALPAARRNQLGAAWGAALLLLGLALLAIAVTFRSGALSLPPAGPGPGSGLLPGLALAGVLAATAVIIGLPPLDGVTIAARQGLAPLRASLLGGLATGAAAIATVRLAGLTPAAGRPALIGILAATVMVLAGLRALSAPRLPALAAALIASQAGWVLAALAIADRRGFAAALLTLAALLVTAPPVLAVAAELEGRPLPGLGRRRPASALLLVVGLGSLAGVPPLAGFFGQFAVAAELVRGGAAWVLAAGLTGGAMTLAGVLRHLGQLYLEGERDEPRRPADTGRWSAGSLLAVLVLIAFGVLADPIQGLAVQGAAALGLRP